MRGVLADVRAERRRPAACGGAFAAHATAALRAETLGESPAVRRMNVEQSNTSVVIDERIVLKGYRKTHSGPQPELEIARFLDAVCYRNTPALLGFVEYEHPASEPMAVCILQRFVRARGDGWSVTLEDLRNASARNPAARALQTARARRLGVRTAELHRAFATPGGGDAFEPEPTTQADLDAWAARARRRRRARSTRWPPNGSACPPRCAPRRRRCSSGATRSSPASPPRRSTRPS